jgi:hypothetical protein
MAKCENKTKLKFEINNVNVNSSFFNYTSGDGNVTTTYSSEPLTLPVMYNISNFYPYTMYNLIYNSDGSDDSNSVYKSTNLMVLRPKDTSYNSVYFPFVDKNGTVLNDATKANKPNLDGEVIIKFNNRNSNTDLYLCFFYRLVDDTKAKNSLYDIMSELKRKTSKEKQFLKDIDLSIPAQKNDAILLTTITNDNFIILTTVLDVYKDSNALTFDNNIAVLPPELTISNKSFQNCIKKDNMSSLSNDDIYIDCSPTGESKETIDTYNLPINSDYMHSAQQYGMMRMTLNMFVCFSCLIFIYAIFPWFYRVYIYEVIEQIDADKIKLHLDSIDVVYLLLVFAFLAIVLPLGIAQVNITKSSTQGLFSILISVFVFFVYTITNFMIMSHRMGIKDNYDGLKMFDGQIWNNIRSNGGELIGEMLSKVGREFNKAAPGNIFFWFSLLILIAVPSVAASLYQKNMPPNEIPIYIANLCFMVFFGIIAYIVIYLIFFLRDQTTT